MSEYKLTTVKLRNEDLEYLREYGGIRKFIEDNLNKNNNASKNIIERDLSTELLSLKNYISEIDNRLKVLENSPSHTVPEKKLKDVISNDLTFYCSYCKSLKSFNGRKKTNENKFACLDCVNKLTPDEQQL